MTGKPSPNDSARYRLPASILFVSSVSLLLVLALLPQGGHQNVNLVPLAGTARLARAVMAAPQPAQHPAFRYLLIQVGGNVLAFVPIGASLAVLLRRRGAGATLLRALAASALLSLSIEIVQLALPTRATDIDDLILNTLGAFLGALVALAWLRRRPRATRA